MNRELEIERLSIDVMNLEVNLRKADFRKLEMVDEMKRIDISKIGTQELIESNTEKIKELEQELSEENGGD